MESIKGLRAEKVMMIEYEAPEITDTNATAYYRDLNEMNSRLKTIVDLKSTEFKQAVSEYRNLAKRLKIYELSKYNTK